MPIAGVWRAGRAGKTGVDRDPCAGGTLLEIQLGNASDVDEAYHAARRAQRAWAQTPPQVRHDILERAAGIFERRKEEIVDWLIREFGNTRKRSSRT